MGFKLSDYIAFGEDTSKEKYMKKNLFEIPKKDLLEALGFTNKNVWYIAYNYKTGILTIKTK